MFATYDIVTVNADCPAEEIGGKSCYIVGAVEGHGDIGVFACDERLERASRKPTSPPPGGAMETRLTIAVSRSASIRRAGS